MAKSIPGIFCRSCYDRRMLGGEKGYLWGSSMSESNSDSDEEEEEEEVKEEEEEEEKRRASDVWRDHLE